MNRRQGSDRSAGQSRRRRHTARANTLLLPARFAHRRRDRLPSGRARQRQFQFVNACHEKGAMILTPNRGFAEWGEIVGSSVVATALMDRLLHHAIVVQIEGSSYRLRRHADLLPEQVRSITSITSPGPADPKRRGRPAQTRSCQQPHRLTRRTAKVGNFTSLQVGIFTATLTRVAGCNSSGQARVPASC